MKKNEKKGKMGINQDLTPHFTLERRKKLFD